MFSKSEGYLGTELLRDEADALRFVTIDRWTSMQAFVVFKRDGGQNATLWMLNVKA